MALVHHLFLFSLLLPLINCTDPIAQYCDKRYSSPDIQSNIQNLVSDLATRASDGGFATSSCGSGDNTVYGLAQCRGDVPAKDCSSCLTNAAKQLPLTCANQADARLWYDCCFMRYDINNFIGQLDTGHVTIIANVRNAPNPDDFNVAVSELMGKVKTDAVSAKNNSLGRIKRSFTQDITIFGLAQCTRDLQHSLCDQSEQCTRDYELSLCDQCLSTALQLFPASCSHRQGCQVLYSSCMVRYEIYRFYCGGRKG